MITPRDEAPKIGGSVGGFIALVVVLSLFILSSLAAVIYLVRTRHPDDHFEDVAFFPSASASARRQRNASTSTAATKDSYGGSRHTRVGTDDSTRGVTAKLAGMFRSLGTARTAGWHRTAEDEDWDDADPAPNMAELGLRRAPSAPVIVHPTGRGQHVSESAEPRQPVRRSTADSDDLSETSTIVVRERPVPAPAHGHRSPTSPLSTLPPTSFAARPGRTPRRMGTGSSAGGSFYSARDDFTPEGEMPPPVQRGGDHMRQNSVESYTGSRFREAL